MRTTPDVMRAPHVALVVVTMSRFSTRPMPSPSSMPTPPGPRHLRRRDEDDVHDEDEDGAGRDAGAADRRRVCDRDVDEVGHS